MKRTKKKRMSEYTNQKKKTVRGRQRESAYERVYLYIMYTPHVVGQPHVKVFVCMYIYIGICWHVHVCEYVFEWRLRSLCMRHWCMSEYSIFVYRHEPDSMQCTHREREYSTNKCDSMSLCVYVYIYIPMNAEFTFIMLCETLWLYTIKTINDVKREDNKKKIFNSAEK